MDRNKKIKVYTGVRNNKTFWSMRYSKDSTVYGYWYVGYFDGQEFIHWKLVWNTALLAAPVMPVKFWLVNQPTEKDFS